MSRSTPQIEAEIKRLLLDGLEGGGDTDDLERLNKLGRLGAQLVFQRAIEEEVERFLGRARFERTPTARGSRNGHRPKQVQTTEGPLTIAAPQVRDSLSRFVSSVIPDCRTAVRTRPLEALVIGAYVRGLSDRDIESLATEAGLGHISRTAVSGICSALRDRFRAFRAKSLADVRLRRLMLDAIYLPVRPDGPKEGVLVALRLTWLPPSSRQGAGPPASARRDQAGAGTRQLARPEPGAGEPAAVCIEAVGIAHLTR